MNLDPANILVAEDQKGLRVTLASNLEDQGYRVIACRNGAEALRCVQETPIDIVISDLHLPDVSGMEVLEALKEMNPEAAFIVMTGAATVETAVQALNEGAFAYITKPFGMEQVLTIVRNALRQQRLLRENRRLVDNLQLSNRELNNEIAERKRLEEQLIQSQKMEAVGRLAGGIAHDFNNLLTPILGYTQIALGSNTIEDNIRKHLQEIHTAANRASNLVRQLLSFARQEIIEPRVIDVNELIIETDDMLLRLIGEHIELVTKTSPSPATIKTDPGQIEQVLVNLVVNARDAMPDGGKLEIETYHVSVVGNHSPDNPELTAGDYVVISVRDNGIGMTEEIKTRIFEPFYTTKGVGKGTGLGLSTCYGIVAQHGGLIKVDSSPGNGTTFKIFFPSVEYDSILPVENDLPTGTMDGLENILLVEDERMVREVAACTLRDHGYTVIEASDGSDGLRIAQEKVEGELQLLLTDMVMPNMGGKELAEKVLQVHPEIRVLYTSGYIDDTVVRTSMAEGDAFMQKPFTPDVLAHKVRAVLDA